MTENEILNELKNEVNILYKLLNKMHLDCHMWKSSVIEYWGNIVDLWAKEPEI